MEIAAAIASIAAVLTQVLVLALKSWLAVKETHENKKVDNPIELKITFSDGTVEEISVSPNDKKSIREFLDKLKESSHDK